MPKMVWLIASASIFRKFRHMAQSESEPAAADRAGGAVPARHNRLAGFTENP
jgi:hypothetical protein